MIIKTICKYPKNTERRKATIQFKKRTDIFEKEESGRPKLQRKETEQLLKDTIRMRNSKKMLGLCANKDIIPIICIKTRLS